MDLGAHAAAIPGLQFRREPVLLGLACLPCLLWRAARVLRCRALAAARPGCLALSVLLVMSRFFCLQVVCPAFWTKPSSDSRFPLAGRQAASCESAGCCGYVFCLGGGLPAESGWFMRHR